MGIRDPFDHPDRREVVHELPYCLLADAHPRGQVGEPDAVEVEVWEQGRVGGADARPQPGRVGGYPGQRSLVGQPRRLEQQLEGRGVAGFLELAPLGSRHGLTASPRHLRRSLGVGTQTVKFA